MGYKVIAKISQKIKVKVETEHIINLIHRGSRSSPRNPRLGQKIESTIQAGQVTWSVGQHIQYVHARGIFCEYRSDDFLYHYLIIMMMITEDLKIDGYNDEYYYYYYNGEMNFMKIQFLMMRINMDINNNDDGDDDEDGDDDLIMVSKIET